MLLGLRVHHRLPFDVHRRAFFLTCTANTVLTYLYIYIIYEAWPLGRELKLEYQWSSSQGYLKAVVSPTLLTDCRLWRIIAKFWTNPIPFWTVLMFLGLFVVNTRICLICLSQWNHKDMIRCLSPPQTIRQSVHGNVNRRAFSRRWRISLLAESHYLHKAVIWSRRLDPKPLIALQPHIISEAVLWMTDVQGVTSSKLHYKERDYANFVTHFCCTIDSFFLMFWQRIITLQNNPELYNLTLIKCVAHSRILQMCSLWNLLSLRMELSLSPSVGKTRKLPQLWKCSELPLKKSHFGCSVPPQITCQNWIPPDKSTRLAPLLPIHGLLWNNTSRDKDSEDLQLQGPQSQSSSFASWSHVAKVQKCVLPTEVMFHSRCFLELIEVKISQFLQRYNVEVAACRLRHPGQIKMLQMHCRNCLILPSCFQNTAKQKVMGWGVSSQEARWSQLHVCFHAPFFRFITSLGECGGVKKNPCHPETGREEQSCSFPSPGPALSSTCELHAWMTLLRGVRGCHMSRLHQPPGSAPETNGCGESEDGKACFISAWKKSMYWC